jgi:UDP-glucose 4-epimerase
LPTETVMVTGGAGYIGSELCKGLLQTGRRVVVFDNLSFGRRDLLPPHPELVLAEGDIRDTARVIAVMKEHRPRRVFHLAAIHFIPYCNAHPVEAMDVNVNGTRSVFQACREVRPELVLFASTAAVYPIERSPFSEEHPVGPLDVYGYTKLMGEDLLRLFHLEAGVPGVVARFFNAVGAEDTNPHLLPDIVAQLRKGSDVLKLGNLDPIRDYIHVEDMAAGILAIDGTFSGRLGLFNIGAGRGYSVRDVVAAFEAALGRPLRIEQEADRVRKVERLELVADVSKLRRETGWAPKVDFNEGVARMVQGL